MGFSNTRHRLSKTFGYEVILCAVKKMTREITAIVRERVLPWYKGEGIEKVKLLIPESRETDEQDRKLSLLF